MFHDRVRSPNTRERSVEVDGGTVCWPLVTDWLELSSTFERVTAAALIATLGSMS